MADLKSAAPRGACEFESRSRHHRTARANSHKRQDVQPPPSTLRELFDPDQLETLVTSLLTGHPLS